MVFEPGMNFKNIFFISENIYKCEYYILIIFVFSQQKYIMFENVLFYIVLSGYIILGRS